MTEQNPEDKLTTLEKLGRVVGLTGHRPIKAIQEVITSDPEKTDAFLRGAEAGQRERMDRDNQKAESSNKSK